MGRLRMDEYSLLSAAAKTTCPSLRAGSTMAINRENGRHPIHPTFR
jgi:hypothetical protein